MSTSTKSYYQQSLELCQQTGNQRGLAIRLTNLGNLALMQKNYWAAEKHYQKSQELFQQLEDRSGVAVSLINLGNIALEMGDNSKAYQHFQDARALATEAGNQSITQGATEGLEQADQKQRDFFWKSLVA